MTDSGVSAELSNKRAGDHILIDNIAKREKNRFELLCISVFALSVGLNAHTQEKVSKGWKKYTLT